MSSLVEQVQSDTLAESHSESHSGPVRRGVSARVWRADVFRLGGEEVMISAEVFDTSIAFIFRRTEDSERFSLSTWLRWSESKNIRKTFAETFNQRYIDVLSEYSVLERLFIVESIYVTVVQNIVKQARKSGLRVSRIYTKDPTFVEEFLT